MANNGSKSRFWDRLKKIVWFKRNKNTNKNEEPAVNSTTTVLKVLAAIPGLVYDNLNDGQAKKEDSSLDAFKEEDNLIQVKPQRPKRVIFKTQDFGRKIKRQSEFNKRIPKDLETSPLFNADKKSILRKETPREIISGIDVQEIKKKQDLHFQQLGVDEPIFKDNISVKEQDDDVKKLEKQIIDLIKKDLIKTLSEVELIYTDLYILSEINGDSVVLEECKKELDLIQNMLKKIDQLKEQYDYLRDNYDFDYLLVTGDNNDLVDKIIELKRNFDDNQVRAVVDDYKLLDEYKSLYLTIDELKEKTVKFQEEKEREEEKLKERDINFEDLKKNVFNVEDANKEYEMFIKNQMELIKELNEKVGKISSYEETVYKLNGVKKLMMQSFKYFGLLMLNPFKGLIPSIAVSTLATRNMIRNLRGQISMSKEEQIVYEATDYSSLLNSAIDDMDLTGNMIDQTLFDIVKLKQQYKSEFEEYYADFEEYRTVIARLNDMENMIMVNKIKVELLKKRAREQKKENEKTLKLVNEHNKNNKSTFEIS